MNLRKLALASLALAAPVAIVPFVGTQPAAAGQGCWKAHETTGENQYWNEGVQIGDYVCEDGNWYLTDAARARMFPDTSGEVEAPWDGSY